MIQSLYLIQMIQSKNVCMINKGLFLITPHYYLLSKSFTIIFASKIKSKRQRQYNNWFNRIVINLFNTIQLQQFRMTSTKIENYQKRKYSRISFKKRELLVKAISQKGQNLTQVSKRLKINSSSARMILRKYNQSGEFRTKNFKNKRNTDLSKIKSVPIQKRQQQNPQLHSQRQPQKIQSKYQDYTYNYPSSFESYQIFKPDFYSINPLTFNFWAMIFPLNV